MSLALPTSGVGDGNPTGTPTSNSYTSPSNVRGNVPKESMATYPFIPNLWTPPSTAPLLSMFILGKPLPPALHHTNRSGILPLFSLIYKIYEHKYVHIRQDEREGVI